MLDTFHLPTAFPGADVQLFTGPQTVTNLQWTTWLKPRGKTMLHLLCIGGGGGGGGGFSATSGNARGGGAGGGSSGITRVTVPLFLLPDVLYIQVGAGGLGTLLGTAGAGILSWVSVYPNFENSNILAVSGATPASGGSNGTSVAAGTQGSGGVIAGITTMPFALLGQFGFTVGQDGAPGGSTGSAGANRSIFSPTTTFGTMGGTGGGGCTSGDFAGGAINALANSLIRTYAPDTTPAGSFNGASGHLLWKPFFSFCGMGAGSSNTLPGGRGGDGGPGSGGGGGGGGNPGGAGGDGGPGLVMMIAW